MPETFYAKGTIKVKNADETMVPFLPTTDTSSISDDNGVSLENALKTINQKIAVAENSGGIELMYEEPTAENTTSFRNETLIGYVTAPKNTWSFGIDTEAGATGERKTGIPFNLYGQNGITLTVDWGDGTVSNLTEGDYESAYSATSASVHEYVEAGEYTVKMKCSNWADLYVDISYAPRNESDNPSLYWFRRTLKTVYNKLPLIKGVKTGTNLSSDYHFSNLFAYCTSLQSIPAGLFDNNTEVVDFSGCFSNCSSLASIPSGLFDKNTEVLYFGRDYSYGHYEGCFAYCSSLQSIPEGLFKNNTKVVDFIMCFDGCTSLQSIPSGLFDNNTAATNFFGCFDGCSSLQSIPEGLFDNNTTATNFFGCFDGCSSLQSIPEGLFDNNTQVTLFGQCFHGCNSLTDFTLHIGSRIVSDCVSFVTSKSGTSRTIYVPSGSTTQTKFNAIASSLGLTIIGE